MRFVKIFRGYSYDIENAINKKCREDNLDIVSISSCINQAVLFVTVVFERKEV